MKVSTAAVRNRLIQSQRLLRSEGLTGIGDRVRARLADRIAPDTHKIPLDAAELRPATSSPTLSGELAERTGPLEVGWVFQPPSAGSGGHTTIFRMVRALELAGHHCTVYLHDKHGWDLRQHEATIRGWWPEVQAPIRDLAAGVADSDALFATSWDTAYLTRVSPARGLRCYFVQDFEPSFYPAGSEYLLAEATYRFGFHGITAGRWLAEMLHREYGMTTDHFDFGCDLDVYRQAVPTTDRAGICYYCRPSTPRRAHELALLALELFHDRHPDVTIHFFGEPSGRLAFPVEHHGLLSPRELGQLYGRCAAGLALSATNVSLVPHEMLAAGCIPVVNDAEHNRLVLDNDHVRYAPATPWDLADALSEIVTRPSAESTAYAAEAADSVQGVTWDDAATQFLDALKRRVRAT